MHDPGLTPDELKAQYSDEVIRKAKTFETNGISRQSAQAFLETPNGELYLRRVIEATDETDLLALRERALGQLMSGKELPRMEMNSEPLVKIVPAGAKPTDYTPFWAKEADLDAAVRQGKNLHEFFGIPVGSESAQYDVYRIQPKSPTEVWVSTIAPISELDGQVKKPGGATQYLIPNRKLYTQGEPIKTVDNRLRVPLLDAERERPKASDHESTPHRPQTPEAPEEPHAHLKANTAADGEPHARVNAGAIRGAVKVAGAAGALYGVADAKNQVDAAIDTARSTREQWIKGTEEAANQSSKTLVTGSSATVGAIPGAALGGLTSPFTGPAGPIVGGLATGGAAAYGAEKLYEDSALQRAARFVGRHAGDIGYDYISKEGRLLREVNGLKEDLSEATDPAERARIEAQLQKTGAAFNKEAERNNRYFEGRDKIDQVWEKMHERIPKVDKSDVEDALARHIDAGKNPTDAMRGAFSDAVHKEYPRALHHEPLENYRALSNAQLADKYRQVQSEIAQDQRQVEALQSIKDSRDALDKGWPKELAQKRHAARVEEGLNELWKDRGHLGAVQKAMQERGMPEPAISGKKPERPAQTQQLSQVPQLTAEQQRYQAQAQAQLAPAMQRAGFSEAQTERITAAAAVHAQANAKGGGVSAFHLGKDGQRVAMIQDNGTLSEFKVQDVLANRTANPTAAPQQEAVQAQAQAVEQSQAVEASIMAR